jgi:hypothetical protein
MVAINNKTCVYNKNLAIIRNSFTLKKGKKMEEMFSLLKSSKMLSATAKIETIKVKPQFPSKVGLYKYSH